jgi:hypothetical protein
MSFLRHLRREHERERRFIGFHTVLFLVFVRGFVLAGVVVSFAAGFAGLTRWPLVSAVLTAAFAGGIASLWYLLGARQRYERLVARDPELRGWRRSRRVIRLLLTPVHGSSTVQSAMGHNPSPTSGVTYDTPIGHDAPLTRRGIVELWILAAAILAGTAVLVVLAR